MLETAVPLPRWFFHATPQHKLSLIRQHGLTPSDESHPGQAAAVYLTHQMSLAQHYAEMNFGENDNQAWVILQIDASALDPARLKPDLWRRPASLYMKGPSRPARSGSLKRFRDSLDSP